MEDTRKFVAKNIHALFQSETEEIKLREFSKCKVRISRYPRMWNSFIKEKDLVNEGINGVNEICKNKF